MKNGLKTISIVNLFAFFTLAVMGCSDDKRQDARVDDPRPHYAAYDHAYLGPEMSGWAQRDAEMAEKPGHDDQENSSLGQ